MHDGKTTTARLCRDGRLIQEVKNSLAIAIYHSCVLIQPNKLHLQVIGIEKPC